MRDPRSDGPHDCGGFHGHSAAPAHRNMGPTGCDASMSNCDVPGSDRDASMSGCDVTSSDDVMSAVSVHVRARALWGLTRNLRKPRNTAKCLPTPSLCFCYPSATSLRFRSGGHPAVKPTAPLSRHYPMMHGTPARVLAQHLGRNLRFKGSPLCDRPRSNSCRHQCRSRHAPSENARPVLGQRTMVFTS